MAPLGDYVLYQSMYNRPIRKLTVRGNGASRVLQLYENEDPHGVRADSGDPTYTTLGRFHGKIRVTADKNRIFSAIREKIDAMEKGLGVELKFKLENRWGHVEGKQVTITVYVYEPIKPGQSEFGRFKKD